MEGQRLHLRIWRRPRTGWGMSAVDREIGPKGYDPYNSAERDQESALEWRWVGYSPPTLYFDDSIIWIGRDGKLRQAKPSAEGRQRLALLQGAVPA